MRAGRVRPHRTPLLWATVLLAGCGCGDTGGGGSSSDTGGSGSGSHGSTALRFRDVAPGRGLARLLTSGGAEKLSIVENIGTGCALLDANGDGRLDIFLPNAGSLVDGARREGAGTALYLQSADGKFSDATSESGLAFGGWTTGAAVGDFDGDADPDIFLACWGPDRLYENRSGHFVNIATAAGVDSPRLSTSAVFLDYDADGNLDLYVARYVDIDPRSLPEPCLENGARVACGPSFFDPAPDALYRGDGNGGFRDVSKEMGITTSTGGYGLGVATGDFDRDGRVDIYVANDTTANHLWVQREAGFVDESLFCGAALSEEGQGQAGMGVAVGDVNADGLPDIFVSNYSQERNALYRATGGGIYENRSSTSGFSEESYLALGWSAAFGDLDNDRDLDLIVANGHVHPRASQVHPSLSYRQACLAYLNDGTGKFRAVTNELGDDFRMARCHRGAALGDIDSDGDLDVLLSVQDGPPVLLLNESPGLGRAILVVLEGRTSNREGIGAELRLEVDGTTMTRHVSRGGGYLSSTDVRTHFGLADAKEARALEVRWPGGRKQRVGPLAAGHIWKVVEQSGEAIRIGRLVSSSAR